MRRPGAVLAALVLAALAGSDAYGQAVRLVRPVRFRDATGFLELGYDFERQEREPPVDGQLFRQEEGALLYGIGGDITGSFLHPSLLPFSVGGTLRLRRSEIDANTGVFQGSRNADASQYRVRLGIAPAFRWNGEITGHQSIQDIDSTFAPTRRVLRRELRATLRRRSRVWPLTFYADRARTEGIEGDPRDERRTSWGFQLDQRGRFSTMRLESELQDYVERSTRQDYRQVRVSLSHRYRALASRTLTFNTTLFGYDRAGTADFRYAIGAESVEWRPNDDFQLGGRLERLEQEDLLGRLVTRRGSIGLEHRLWGSLVTTAAADLQDTDLPEAGTETLREYRAGLDYTRHLTAGTLHLAVGRRLRRDDQDLPARRRIVSEEHLVEDGLPILLDTPGIEPDTIEVTDVTGTVVYTEGIDYEVLAAGGVVELRILPGSAIQAGDTILVRFAVTTSPALDVRTRSNRYLLGWRDRSGVWFRLSRTKQAQDLIAGTPDGRIDQTLEKIYSGGVSRRRWQIEGTRHTKKSFILPFARWNASLRWGIVETRFLQFDFDAMKQRTTFPDRPGERIDLERAGVDLRLRLRRTRLTAGLDRWDEFVLDREGRYFEAHLQLDWRFRAFELVARARRRLQDIELSGRDDRDEVVLLLRRYFR
ncbi:MAG: hypothetical protein D6718_09710 [Acidobacteria bacterium]|nr:MAG: hypothetical protein D6718_09710 [Acidobacteriota bacterium]